MQFPEGCKLAGVDIIRWPWRSQPDWPYYSEPPTGVTAKDCSLAELEITTDPTDAPADALLEAAGQWVMPDHRCYLLINGMVARYDGLFSEVNYFHPAGLTSWDPYSWDVPNPTVASAMSGALDRMLAATEFKYDIAAAKAGALWPLMQAEGSSVVVTPCPKCNGTGRVAGALGVGIEWPCECVGGAG